MTSGTKSRILDTALDLFNEKGVSVVTTNHIAAALGISPGNLYYHYRNKAEIIRALFDRIMLEWALNYAVPEGVMPDLARMESMLEGNFDIQARYRFLFRDLTLLLHADDALARVYQAHRKTGIENTRRLIDLFIQSGVLEPLDDADAIDDLAQLLWLVGDFWLVFRDTGGDGFTQDDTDRGLRLFRRLIAPHLKRT